MPQLNNTTVVNLNYWDWTQVLNRAWVWSELKECFCGFREVMTISVERSKSRRLNCSSRELSCYEAYAFTVNRYFYFLMNYR